MEQEILAFLIRKNDIDVWASHFYNDDKDPICFQYTGSNILKVQLFSKKGRINITFSIKLFLIMLLSISKEIDYNMIARWKNKSYLSDLTYTEIFKFLEQ